MISDCLDRCTATCRKYKSKLVEQSTKLIYLHDTNSHYLLANPVQRQNRLLIGRFHGYKAHSGSLCGLPDRLCIGGIIFIRFDIWPDELCGDQSDVVSERS
ncbi:hypothetical protein WM40_27475 [Robbsia andropogonis]|uniref:Uncharacterized protein n=1 Tax=Robbsia andropogonis TaxID=28092 RepID=A0A0F5JSV0_9BURK|nr:hypothetical protein WM40_27475 [Robbsia andropogonis]